MISRGLSRSAALATPDLHIMSGNINIQNGDGAIFLRNGESKKAQNRDRVTLGRSTW